MTGITVELRPAVKICGLCRPEDTAAAVRLGASFVGVILSRRGPRFLAAEAASEVLARRGDARAVGVFVDEPAARVERLTRLLALDVVQLHGREDEATVAALAGATGAVIWKAVRVRDGIAAAADAARYAPHVDGILLDAFREGVEGGAGTRFDWAAVADVRAALGRDVQLIVAGGLTPWNVAEAVSVLRPDAVDVSSGVEARVRQKSEARMRAFIERAQAPAGRVES